MKLMSNLNRESLLQEEDANCASFMKSRVDTLWNKEQSETTWSITMKDSTRWCRMLRVIRTVALLIC